jgi:alpha-1,2-mannosyltransferase
MDPRRRRLAAAAVVTTAAFLISFLVTPSDFAQDYLAASAVRNGTNPNALSRDLAQRFGLPTTLVTSRQTAHPPFVTALSLPFASLPWPEARLLWQLGLCILTAALLPLTDIGIAALLLLSPAWIFGLALGNVDAIVVCLCLIAAKPRCVALSLGIATALKVYPALLILGLFTIGRRREAITSCIVAGVSTLGATWLIGLESLTGWLQFIPRNGDMFAVNMLNLSLSKLAGLADLPTFVTTLLGLIALASLFRKNTIEPLFPAILLVSPVSWLQSLPLASNVLSRAQLILCSVCSSIIFVSWFSGLRLAAYFGVVASFVLTAVIATTYARSVHRASR